MCSPNRRSGHKDKTQQLENVSSFYIIGKRRRRNKKARIRPMKYHFFGLEQANY
jgi:hypothetical protein